MEVSKLKQKNKKRTRKPRKGLQSTAEENISHYRKNKRSLGKGKDTRREEYKWKKHVGNYPGGAR